MKRILLSLVLCLLMAMPVFADDVERMNNAMQYVDTGTGLSNIREIGLIEFKHIGVDGEVLWHGVSFNSLLDDGEQMFLDCVLRSQNCPTTFYLRLADSTSTCSIIDTNTVAQIVAFGQPSTNGYAHQTITRDSSGWPTLSLDSGDYQATSSVETFSASGGSWGPVHCAWLSNSNADSGTYPTAYAIAAVALSQGRTLANGESLQATLKIKLQ